MQVEYNTGNIEKYKSKNPLKRSMVERLNYRILDIVGNIINNKADVRILDAGCGEGFIDRLIIDRYPGVRITGLEFTKEAITIAKATNPSVEYIQGDVCNMPFKDRSFDFVLCTEVLEHLQDPEKAMKEIMRVSTGRFLITVPNEPWFCIGNMIVLKNISRLGNPIDHINHWTKGSFTDFLRKTMSEKLWGGGGTSMVVFHGLLHNLAKTILKNYDCAWRGNK